MTARLLSRRAALLLPIILAACGEAEEPLTNFQPLRYDYLPPIGLNVASLEIRQQFFPSGARPDVTAQDPAPPIAALKTMAQDRLKTYGASGKAIFSILDASLTQRGDAIDGSMMVTLTILGDDNRQVGVARAQVNRHRTGLTGGLRRTLYDFTKTMMDDMNVEFEYQVRHSLKTFLIEPTAAAAPVEQTPLDGRQAPPLNQPGTLQSPGTLQPPGSLQPPGTLQPPGSLQSPGALRPPGYPQAPTYPQPPGYPQSPGYPQGSGYPQAPGYPQVPTYPQAPGSSMQPTRLGVPPASYPPAGYPSTPYPQAPAAADPFAAPPSDPFLPPSYAR